MAAARSKVGILQPGCPRIALASCPARAVHRLTDHCPCADNVWHFSDSRSFLLQWGGGLLACARRAAGLQLSCCAPGSSPAYLTAVQSGRAIARPALPKVRPRPPAPHAPRLAHAHPPCRSPRHWPSFAPISQLIQSVCPDFCAGLDESFRMGCSTSVGHVIFVNDV